MIVSILYRYMLMGFLLVLILPSGYQHGKQIHRTARISSSRPPTQIPFNTQSYGTDVETWWAAHPFNPESVNYIPIGSITSPEPITNVQQQFQGNIQAAIDALPSTGGTLYFEPGTYTNNFKLIGKSNVHFISDGGAVLSGGPGWVVGCQEALDYSDIAAKVHSHDLTSIACVTTNRIQNIYFKNITFDGGGTALNAINLSAANGVVFDNNVFQNFFDPGNSHNGVVNGNVDLENTWFRGTHFVGKERWALYLDGAHFSGVVQSTIDFNFGDPKSSSGGLLFMANNDLNGDYNQNGVLEPNEKRNANYIIIAQNYFGSDGDIPMHTGIAITGANILIEKNTVVDHLYRFVYLMGKCDAINPGVDMRFENLKVEENEVSSADIFTHVDGNKYNCSTIGNTMAVGKYIVRDNMIEAPKIPALVLESNPPLESPNLVENNCVGGKFSDSGAPCTLSSPGPIPIPNPTPTPTPKPNPGILPDPGVQFRLFFPSLLTETNP